ncbi:helix-turn-helix domain-containing protein [Burkholderia pseudomallei]
MTVEEAAAFLFVSRAHVRVLAERGVLIEVLPRRQSDNLDIDPVSA